MATIIKKRVIPGDGSWGVAPRYDNGTQVAYPAAIVTTRNVNCSTQIRLAYAGRASAVD
jgi:hypothetical protein